MKHKAKYVGDLLAGQQEDFRLTGETGRDWAKEEAEAAQRAEQARQQRNKTIGLWDGPPFPLNVLD